MFVFALLTTLFVILKLTHELDWPWLYVLLPAIIALAAWVVACLAATATALKVRKEFRR